jgi:hypothetical protein
LAYNRTARSRSLAKSRGLVEGYRSGLEEVVCGHLNLLGVLYKYEPFKIEYRVEETKRYTPDIVLLKNGIIVETKGRFVTADRKKHKLIKAQHPDLDLRFVFSNPNGRISKTSKTTYALWCQTNGFQYAAKAIPQEWIAESVNGKSLAIIERLMENTK